MSLDEKLADLDTRLKGLRMDALVLARRVFDPEAADMESEIEICRRLVAEIRLELTYLRERME